MKSFLKLKSSIAENYLETKICNKDIRKDYCRSTEEQIKIKRLDLYKRTITEREIDQLKYRKDLALYGGTIAYYNK